MRAKLGFLRVVCERSEGDERRGLGGSEIRTLKY